MCRNRRNCKSIPRFSEAFKLNYGISEMSYIDYVIRRKILGNFIVSGERNFIVPKGLTFFKFSDNIMLDK